MSRRALAVVAVNLALCAVLGEAAAAAIYYARSGRLFYTHDWVAPAGDVAADAGERRLATADALHPYFGPTHKPGHDFHVPDDMREGPVPARARPVATNNFGFVSPYDYPFPRGNPQQYLVGIFGGSVGVWFCQVGAERLVRALKGHPFFTHKALVPLCFSHEGYKQPQQLLVLSYFLSIGQPFDLVVNIDGFNEVAIARLNDAWGSDISMPSRLHLDPIVNLVDQATLTPEKLASLAAIDRYRERLATLAARRRAARLAVVGVALEEYRRRTERAYRAELVRFAELPSAPAESLVHVTPRTAVREGPALFRDIAAQWANASVLMHGMLAARGIPYLHVLQPNQYATTRRFGAAEAAVARNPASPFKEGAERGYPALRDAATLEVLRAAGVRFFDATGIFDAEAAPVYMDDCCHYTRRGNELLAEFVARAIVRSPGPWAGVAAAGVP